MGARKSKRMSTTGVLPPDRPSIEPRTELSKSAAKYAKRKALRPYLILCEPGHLRHVGAYLDRGWLEPPKPTTSGWRKRLVWP